MRQSALKVVTVEPNWRISCPCGNRGRAGDDVAFEMRGQLRGRPVQKCLTCGQGLILKRPKGRVTLIPPAQWEAMERLWDDEFGDDITTYAGVSVGDTVELVVPDGVTEVHAGARGTVEEISAMSSALRTWIGIRWADGEFSNVFPDDGAVLRVVDADQS